MMKLDQMFGRKKASKTKDHKFEDAEEDSSVSKRPHSAVVRASDSAGLNIRFCPAIISKDSVCQTESSSVSDARDKPSMLYRVSRVLNVILLAYVSICVVVMSSTFLQSLLMYVHVVNWPTGDIQQLHRFNLHNARNIHTETSDGLVLNGYHLLPAEAYRELLDMPNPLTHEERESFFDRKLASSQRLAIYFHGNAANRAVPRRLEHMKHISAMLDAHVLCIDYRGFGDNPGWPSEQGTFLDAVSVIDWVDGVFHRSGLQTHGYFSGAAPTVDTTTDTDCTASNSSSSSSSSSGAPLPRLYVYGHSLGTAVSIQLAEEFMVRSREGLLTGLVLDSGFTSVANAVLHNPATAPFRLNTIVENIMRSQLHFKYPSIETITKIFTNIFLIHGSDDIIIPAFHSQQLFEAVKNTSFAGDTRILRHFELPGVDHNHAFRSETWQKELRHFAIASEHARASSHTCSVALNSTM